MKTLMQHVLEHSTNIYSNKIAVSYGKDTYTFNDIEKQSDDLAIYLKSAGVKRGDRVVVLLGNTMEFVISFWAILKAGAIVIPVGSELKPNKIEYILKDSGACVLIINAGIANENLDMLKSQQLHKIIIPQCPNEILGDLIEGFEAAITTTTKKLQPSGVISKDLAAIIYTSGSTGQPKGVMLSHENMIAATHSLNGYLKYNENDKVLCALPLSFDYGLYQMIMCISTGAQLLLEKEFSWPIFLLKKIQVERATILPVVPTMVMLFHEQNKNKKFDLTSVRSVTNTGAALTRNNIEMVKSLFPNTQIFSMYGLTECKRCTYLPPEDIDKKINSVGIAIPNTELWLVDEDDNRIETPNTPGQLVIRGATVMQGYWNKPEKTAEKLKPGIYPKEYVLYTGDYCSLDEDNYLYFQGRMDHMINSRGIKVSPKEVEDFLITIPQINAVAVIGIAHENYGEALFAFIVLKEGETISEEEIKLICKNTLEIYKVPEYISIIKAIPKTPNGKFNLIELKTVAVAHVNESSKLILE